MVTNERAMNMELVKPSTVHLGNGIPNLGRITKWGNDYIILINEKSKLQNSRLGIILRLSQFGF